MTVADVGEKALINRVLARVGKPHAWITTGIGDDAAVMVLGRGESVVATVDSLVEDVHFRRKWTDAGKIGRKAVAVSLSDLAAMGAFPRAVLLSLMLPGDLSLADFDAIVDGVVSETAAQGASLAGGNITHAPRSLTLDTTAIGTVHPRRVLTRGGGRAGDYLFVTGTIGAASAGLAMLEAGGARNSLTSAEQECIHRYEVPVPLVRCGRTVAGYRAASACMDLSDGLADAARQLAKASSTGVSIEAARLPIHPGARAWWEARGIDALASALCGGEDYELLFAVPPKRCRAFLAATARAQVTATRVGSLTADSGVGWVRNGDSFELPLGHAHLR